MFENEHMQLDYHSVFYTILTNIRLSPLHK